MFLQKLANSSVCQLRSDTVPALQDISISETIFILRSLSDVDYWMVDISKQFLKLIKAVNNSFTNGLFFVKHCENEIQKVIGNFGSWWLRRSDSSRWIYTYCK